jgi:hypothetical protein
MKKANKKIVSAAIFVILISSIACYFPQFVSSDDMVATEVEKTMENILRETETAKQAATYTPYPTYTPEPTYTSEPDYYYWPYNQYWPSDSGTWLSNSCNNANFVSETIKDNSVFNPGETFTKTWTLKNVGRCTWTTDYKLVFVSGNTMSGDTVSRLPYAVPPGGTVVVSVDLKAPTRLGTYKGEWSLQTDDGYNFARFWVQIKVR